MSSRSLLPLLLTAACAGGAAPSASAEAPQAPAAVRLTLGAYTTPREPYGKVILPAFAAKWKAEHGQDVTFEESYQASGAQARAVVGGFEADVVALSLEQDVTKIEQASLITHPWKSGPSAGIVTGSIVVLAVRPGNPKNIHDWSDLARPDVAVVTPNVKTSGGAMWNVAALHGAALRGKVTGVPAGDAAAAETFLASVLRNVKVMDKSGRESLVTFENGVGDVAITYENEVFVAKKGGVAMDYVVPTSTIYIENPVAVVDVYADKHGTRAVADAFVAYLFTPDAQRAFADHGYRPVDPTVTTTLPTPTDLFTIRDLGGWPEVQKSLFDAGALYERALERATQ